MPKMTIDDAKLPKDWYLINAFNDLRAGLWYVRVRNGVDPNDPEVTRSGKNLEEAFENVCNQARQTSQ